MQTGCTLTSDLLEQAADPQRWKALHGSPLPAPQLQPDKPSSESPAGSQLPASQPQSFPTQQLQLQVQAQQQSPQAAASLDPFADPQPIAFSIPAVAQTGQQQQWQRGPGHNLQANPFDEASQPFMQQQQPAAPLIGGISEGSHGVQQLGVGVDLHEHPPLLSAFAPQANPFDEFSQPFMLRPTPPLGGLLDAGHGTQEPGLIMHEQPPLLSAPAQAFDSQQSPLDDMLMPPPPPRPPKPLQHYQSTPKGALPRPKSSSLQRYTDTPTHAAQKYASSLQLYQPTASRHDSPTAVSASAPSALPVLANPFAQSSFGNMALTHPSAPVLRVQKADTSPTGSPSSSPMKGRPEGHAADAPLALDARLPPLHPKLSAQLTLLAAGHGSVFAGPSSSGFGLLQWARPEGNMRQPTGANSRYTTCPDFSLAPHLLYFALCVCACVRVHVCVRAVTWLQHLFAQ